MTFSKDGSLALYKAASTLEEKTLGTISQIETRAIENDIERIIFSPKTLLSENDFEPAITGKAKFALFQQLRGITAYTQALSQIGSGDYQGRFIQATKEAKNALDKSIASLNELGKFVTEGDLKIISSSARAFATAVGWIIDSNAKKKAADIVARTDKDFSIYMTKLANVFANSSNITEIEKAQGLAGIIVNEIQMRKTHLIAQYDQLGSGPSDADKREKWLVEREKIARAFSREKRGGDLSVSFAIALHDACLALGKAHHDIALKAKESNVLDDLELAIGRIQYLAEIFNEATKVWPKEK
ncbi:MAG: hypothetical protein NTU60_11235 [Candidatus Aminicenantes bacterium]|nr:hypothetical protein [Candidatus Aminicenantes bacterium]